MEDVVLALLRRRMPATTWSRGLERFTLAQSLSGAGDALVAISLANSLFFSLSPDASRQQVLLYLLINMAPFALLAPLIGPAIDRFRLGHRLIAVVLFVIRALCAIALAFALLDLALYFFALALLIAAKASGVTRQALVPNLVDRPDQLVAANSRIARLNVFAGMIGGGVGAGLLLVSSPATTLALASAAFIGAAVATTVVPEPSIVVDPVTSLDYEQVHMPSVSATAWAFTLVRASVGYFVFGLAFALRRESEPPWLYAAAVVAYGVGTFGGNAIAPLLRRRYREEGLTVASIASLALVAAFGALGPSRPLVLVVAVVLGGAASVGRQSFDSLLQARAPQATRGRAFARFETRFQMGWVLGAIAATAFGVPIQVSLGVLALALVPSAVLYVRAIREAEVAHVDNPFDPVEVARRRLELVAEWQVRDLPRVAASELTSVVDLVSATGFPIEPALLIKVDALRLRCAAADPDQDDVDWLLAHAHGLVTALETARSVDVQPSAVGTTTGSGPDGESPSDEGSASPSPPSPPSASPSGTEPSCSSTSDDDVGVQSSPERPKVTTRRDRSASER